MVVIEGEPVGKGRPRLNAITRTVYTPQKTRIYESAVKLAAAVSKDRLGSAPVLAVVTAYFSIPKSKRKADREAAEKGLLFKRTKPDVDNLIKSALDGLQPVVFDDDSQIVACVGVKAFSTRPRLEVELYKLTEKVDGLLAEGEGFSVEAPTMRGLMAKILAAGESSGAGYADRRAVG